MGGWGVGYDNLSNKNTAVISPSSLLMSWLSGSHMQGTLCQGPSSYPWSLTMICVFIPMVCPLAIAPLPRATPRSAPCLFLMDRKDTVKVQGFICICSQTYPWHYKVGAGCLVPQTQWGQYSRTHQPQLFSCYSWALLIGYFILTWTRKSEKSPNNSFAHYHHTVQIRLLRNGIQGVF